MKKLIILSLIVICLIFTVSCSSKDYDKRTIDYLGSDFSWDFSINEAKGFIKDNQLYESEITVESTNQGTTIVSDDMYTMRFNDGGKLEFINYNMGQDHGCLSILEEWYGKYDEVESANEYSTKYHWYGKMAGENTDMYLEYCGDNYYLRFVIE